MRLLFLVVMLLHMVGVFYGDGIPGVVMRYV
jgi:hypothetical protein